MRLSNIINEISIDALEKKFVDTNKIKRSTFDDILQVTDEKSAYATWLASRLVKNDIKDSDIKDFDGVFKIFDTYKNKFPKKDINQIKSSSDIRQFLSKVDDIKKETENDPSKIKGVNKLKKYKKLIVGKTDSYIVFQIERGSMDLYKASCDLGSGTGWCTATGKSRSHFDNYTESGDLYIFYPKNGDSGEKVQVYTELSFESYRIKEMQDSDANDISHDQLRYDYNEIYDWLSDEGIKLIDPFSDRNINYTLEDGSTFNVQQSITFSDNFSDFTEFLDEVIDYSGGHNTTMGIDTLVLRHMNISDMDNTRLSRIIEKFYELKISTISIESCDGIDISKFEAIDGIEQIEIEDSQVDVVDEFYPIHAFITLTNSILDIDSYLECSVFNTRGDSTLIVDSSQYHGYIPIAVNEMSIDKLKVKSNDNISFDLTPDTEDEFRQHIGDDDVTIDFV